MECLFEVDEVEQGTVGLELDEEVDVAVVVGFATSDRSEYRDRAPTVLADESKDLVAPLSEQRGQRTRVGAGHVVKSTHRLAAAEAALERGMVDRSTM